HFDLDCPHAVRQIGERVHAVIVGRCKELASPLRGGYCSAGQREPRRRHLSLVFRRPQSADSRPGCQKTSSVSENRFVGHSDITRRRWQACVCRALAFPSFRYTVHAYVSSINKIKQIDKAVTL